MQNWPSNFQSFSFQFSNFQFYYFSPLTFNCCQFGTPLNSSYVLPLIESKLCRFGSFFNKFRNLKKKKTDIRKKKKKRATPKSLVGKFPTHFSNSNQILHIVNPIHNNNKTPTTTFRKLATHQSLTKKFQLSFHHFMPRFNLWTSHLF